MDEAQLPTAEAVERALQAVYARPEFTPAAPSPITRWIGGLWDRVREFLAGLFHMAGADGRTIGRIVIALIAIAGVVLVAYLVLVARDAWRARERRRARAHEAAPAPAAPRADEWEARARAAAGAGRWREAVLALYQALLLRLDAAGVVRYDPSKTPGDYRREARRAPDARRVLDAFLRPFEPVAFGGRAADEAVYDALRRAVGEAGGRG
ncbi:MAG TPA: DUF4129 domain-containing protein [Longimicrobiales bacterium]